MKSKTGFTEEKFLPKKLRARMTVEASCVLPVILFSLFFMIQAAMTMHEKVQQEAELEWNNKYVVKIVRALGD